MRVIVIRGAGTRSFSAGADISEFADKRSTPDRALDYNRRVGRAVGHGRRPGGPFGREDLQGPGARGGVKALRDPPGGPKAGGFRF